MKIQNKIRKQVMGHFLASIDKSLQCGPVRRSHLTLIGHDILFYECARTGWVENLVMISVHDGQPTPSVHINKHLAMQFLAFLLSAPRG